MSVTVVIPTYKRAEYLGTALESVQRQTALTEVDKIIVSENSDNDSSRQVCDQFPGLKITYIQQQNPLTALEHLGWIIDLPSSKYTAMLHDDDWWYPQHLETGLNCLKNESIGGYFSNYVYTQNNILKSAFFHYPSFISHVSDKRSAFEPVIFSLKELAVLTYLYTPFHMSGMIAETGVLQKASEESLKLSQPFYTDRILYPYLANIKPVAFQPQILCAIRLHPENNGNTITGQEKKTTHLEGSEKISALAKENNIDILKEWALIKEKITPGEWAEVLYAYSYYFGNSFDDPSNPFSVENLSPHFFTRLKRKLKSWI